MSKEETPESIQKQRARLRKMLVLKLKAKYGGVSISSKVGSIIEGEVDAFIKKVKKVKQDELLELEERIKALCIGGSKIDRPSTAPSVRSTTNLNSTNSEDEKPLINSGAMTSRKQNLKEGDELISNVTPYELIATLDQLKNEKKEKIKLQERRLNTKNMISVLESQVNMKRSKKEKEKYDDKLFAAHLAEDTIKWKHEEALKSDNLHTRFMEEKTIREAQIMANNKKKHDEKVRRRVEEERNLARCSKLLADEKSLTQAKKDEQKKRYMEIMEENKRQRVIRDAEKKKEAAYDLKLMQDYKEMLDKQEEARRMWYASTYEKQEKRQKANFKDRAEEFRKEKELLERIDNEFHQKLELDRKKDEEKKRERERRQKETNETLKMQIDMKHAQSDRLKKENLIFAERAIKQDEKERIEEERKKSLRQEMAFRNKKALEVQIQTKKALCKGVSGVSITDDEIKMNKSLIEKIKSEPHLYNELKGRIISRKDEASRPATSKKPTTALY